MAQWLATDLSGISCALRAGLRGNRRAERFRDTCRGSGLSRSCPHGAASLVHGLIRQQGEQEKGFLDGRHSVSAGGSDRSIVFPACRRFGRGEEGRCDGSVLLSSPEVLSAG